MTTKININSLRDALGGAWGGKKLWRIPKGLRETFGAIFSKMGPKKGVLDLR